MQVLAVPVKALGHAKRRLSPLLSPGERAALTVAMLDGVLDAAGAQDGWDVWVVAPGAEVLEAAARRGARPVPDTAGSLRGALRQVEREAAALDRSATLAVLLADLPTITAEALGRALAEPGDVVAAPAASDGGTNLLVRRPLTAIPHRFGRSSFDRHRAEALRAVATFREVVDPALAFDLDTPEDLLRLAGAPASGRASLLLAELGLAARLGVSATG
jgi:2-phospho-L-lactate guanylyltransferase